MLRYFIYCRKSSEDEDRQVLSIESQMNELKRMAERLNLTVVNILTESKSAKEPGRPIFDEMINKINHGKADGIVCWKLDRLARNPIDGGQIIWLLQRGILKHIQTIDRAYYPEDNVLLMNMEFGMANQFILDLSRNVKRGLKTKVEKGWLPTTAPLGYLNDKTQEKGKREIIKDPERFVLVKKMWQMMCTGNYTPPKIALIANEKWGFRSPHGRYLRNSTIYQTFTNPFYYGWFEYPKGSGNWYEGKHEPMITQQEYDRVQILLGKRGKPRVKKHDFAFTGLIRCGECGAMVTAEEKNQIICPECKFKFSSNNKLECPKCKTPIEKMKKPKILYYLYYHCTKQKNPNCTQGSIESNTLKMQIDQYLSSIQISEYFKNWAIKVTRKESDNEFSFRKNVSDSQKRAYDNCLRKLKNLYHLVLSPENINENVITYEEFATAKAELMKEKARLEEILNDSSGRINRWLEIGEDTFKFACYARIWFEKGDPQLKSGILQALGSNLTLKDKKLLVELREPLVAIKKVVKMVPEAKTGFEPKKMGLNELKLEVIYAQNAIVRGRQDSNLELFFWREEVYH